MNVTEMHAVLARLIEAGYGAHPIAVPYCRDLVQGNYTVSSVDLAHRLEFDPLQLRHGTKVYVEIVLAAPVVESAGPGAEGNAPASDPEQAIAWLARDLEEVNAAFRAAWGLDSPRFPREETGGEQTFDPAALRQVMGQDMALSGDDLDRTHQAMTALWERSGLPGSKAG